MPVLIELGLSPVAAPHFADAEVLDAVLRSTRRRAQQPRGLRLIAASFFKRAGHQVPQVSS
jgi:hypothetical protein